ncbi:PQQ-dependent sugar dehydrogenase [Sphingomonas quercus]|uniref:Sorbosone dehydrogenase family protein n=1 Tax=Sphingomonas quercus TaxID=2842451 RepID=A0ABS6BLT4_9SPHN|nr:sorbosone dehydrogenase family protein [Sphingomonas quercus]MBU3079144.1 sorbosone dehydrogenase family protein [Sphingomonas quercus]
MRLPLAATTLALALMLAGCGNNAKLPIEQNMGPRPTLPEPSSSMIPTVNVAKAVGWPEGAKPKPAQGLTVTPFATGLRHPRWLLALPNGDVLVAETDAPPKPADGKGIRAWFQRQFMKRAGSGREGSANRITLLRDADGDGVAELRSVFISGLNSPFGMTLSGDTLYVADTDAVLAFPYAPGETKITTPPRKVVDLPAGTINHHWTKNVIASDDGKLLYVTIGSNSNVGENGIAAEEGRAAIWEVNAATGAHRIYAAGIRNPNGMAWEPTTRMLWTVANERDELGGDLVPDYLTSVQFGGFYGWPWNYWGDNVDTRVKDPKPSALEVVTPPDYALGSHTASLGLSFAAGAALGPRFADGAFIGQHGSWNRKPRSGYKVIFVPFANGKPNGMPIDVLSGFLNADGEAQGRPVGVTIDTRGGLLVADDVGNSVWRVSAPGARPAPSAAPSPAQPAPAAAPPKAQMPPSRD